MSATVSIRRVVGRHRGDSNPDGHQPGRPRSIAMGFIRSALFISLDGVVEAPQTWHFPYLDDQMGAAVGELMSGNDATLLGRNTYEEFAGYWPNADPADPMTAAMNGARKYVVSTTLTEASWSNSTVINGDVAAALTQLKADTRLGTTGSATLVRWLLEYGLLDELHLLVHPIVVGHGKKLFPEGSTVPLRLLSSTTFETGVLHLVYAGADGRPVPDPVGSHATVGD
jgi:dihydrofolate reductase